MVNNWNNNISGWWFGTFFMFHNIWVVILPIDELHHFSRWFFNHQPAGISNHHFKMLAGKRDLKINVRRVNVCVMGQPRFTTAE